VSESVKTCVCWLVSINIMTGRIKGSSSRIMRVMHCCVTNWVRTVEGRAWPKWQMWSRFNLPLGRLLPYTARPTTSTAWPRSHYMVHCLSWEGCWFFQLVTLLLGNPKIHFRVQRNPSSDPILSQMILVHTFTHCFSDIYFNIILQTTPWSPMLSLPFRFW